MTRPGRRSPPASLSTRRDIAPGTLAAVYTIIGVCPVFGVFVAAIIRPGSPVVFFTVFTTLTIAASLVALVIVTSLLPPLPFLLRFRDRLRGFPASSLTDLAALLAGRGRPALRAEWRAHLAGESGRDPVTWRKVRQALGFVASAVQLRLADAADLAWRPADAVLGSRTLSNLFVGGPVIVVLFAIVHHDGRFGLVADIQDPAALGAFLYGVIRTGRWWRGVKPREPKARRARE